MSKIVDQYRDSIVAFADILGFRQLVCQSKSNAVDVIKTIDESISHVVKIVKSETAGLVSVKLFSDCVCLSCADSELDLIIRELCFLQLFLATKGIFVKGGLSQGNHFENETIIFSEGLIRVYDLQVDNSYPRVTVDDVLVKRIRRESDRDFGYELVDYLAVAPDGRYFLDYLQTLTEEGISGQKDDFMGWHKQAILNQVEKNENNYRVVAKYKWLAEYHNYKFSQFCNLSDYCEEYHPELVDKMHISSGVFPSFRVGSLGFSKVRGPEGKQK